MYYVTTLTLVYFIFTNIEVMLKIHNWQSSSTWVVTPPPIRESCSVTKNNPPIKNILNPINTHFSILLVELFLAIAVNISNSDCILFYIMILYILEVNNKFE